MLPGGSYNKRYFRELYIKKPVCLFVLNRSFECIHYFFYILFIRCSTTCRAGAIHKIRVVFLFNQTQTQHTRLRSYTESFGAVQHLWIDYLSIQVAPLVAEKRKKEEGGLMKVFFPNGYSTKRERRRKKRVFYHPL